MTEITFTKEQEEAINHGGKQLLIKGIAGSGKTLVLLKTAVNAGEEDIAKSVGIFSFGNPLSKAAESMLKDYNLSNVRVFTFHKWAHQAYNATIGKPLYIPKGKYFMSDAFKDMKIKYPEHRFFKNKDLYDFLREEISWLKGRNIKSKEEYLSAPRKGRGSKVRLSVNDRGILYEFYMKYEDLKGKYLDYDDTARALANVKDHISNKVKFDHIIIDEAQDLSKVSLEVLVACARESCRIGADIGQKIYPTTFTWKETGLDFRGNRVKTLQQSFRSTKQIVELASSLQRNDEIVKDNEFTIPEIPTNEGQMPIVMVTPTVENHDRLATDFIMKLKEQSPNASIGVLARNWDSAVRVQKQLHALSVPFEEIGAPSYAKRNFTVNQGTHVLPGIKFTTFHTAKGLEFSYVVIIDLVNPNGETRMGDEFDWDLERRLLYVAMTRAKAELVMITHDKNAKLIRELDEKLYNLVEV